MICCASEYNFLMSRSIQKIKFQRHMHQWSSSKIRSTFKSFHEQYNHVYIPSSSVIPWSDNTLNFVNAGMNQFKSSLLGQKPFPANRATNSQKCIRMGGKHNDLSAVGKDTYHHTFFEMLGSWSFNDYFKDEACKMSWELITSVFNIPTEHLYVTYFSGDTRYGLQPDEEVRDIWRSLGVPNDRILPFGLKDNFWEMGEVGPCGPCTEIHFERHPSVNGRAKVNSGVEDIVELWNLVFIQYQRTSDGELLPLQSRCVDTGMGLERMTACLNGKSSNYDTDLFIPIIGAIEKMSGKSKYKGSFSANADCLDTYYRTLADHCRMIAIALADGLLPHDSIDLHRIIRRSLSIGWEKFGLESTPGFMGDLIHIVTDILGETYPELKMHFERSKCLLQYAEEMFLASRLQMTKDWNKLIEACPPLAALHNPSLLLVQGLQKLLPKMSDWKGTFPVAEAKRLLDDCGLSIESIEDVATTLGYQLDVIELRKLIEQKPRSEVDPFEGIPLTSNTKKLASILKEKSVEKTDDSFKYDYISPSGSGYSFHEHPTSILEAFSDQGSVQSMKKGDLGVIVTRSTNFYSAAGGQTSDRGLMRSSDDNIFKVTNVKSFDGYVLHFGQVTDGVIDVGADVTLEVDKGARLGAARSHTAHHLLIAAIKAVTGMAYQRSSKVSENDLRLTLFVYPPLTVEQLIQAEKIVQEWISQHRSVTRETLSIFQLPRNEDINLVSGKQYPEDVHRVSTTCTLPPTLLPQSAPESDTISVTSSELCCGTHVYDTAHIGSFAITEYEPQEKGVTLIAAVHGKRASKLNAKGKQIKEEFDAWDSKIISKVEKNERLREMFNEFRKWKGILNKSLLPATVYWFIEKRAKYLTERVDELLVVPSNWEELLHEFKIHLEDNDSGPVIYKMKNDYRGSNENLKNIMKEVSGRPAAFVCSGWGKVRACIHVPKDPEEPEKGMNKLLEELQQFVTVNNVSVETYDAENILLKMIGVKREKKNDIKKEIIEICSNWFHSSQKQ